MKINLFNNFYENKTVLITGSTGFKGSWLSIWLHELGANVIGYSLNPPYEKSLFESAGLAKRIIQIKGDVRDISFLEECFEKYSPDLVIHLAAQSLVRKSYEIPRETFETNIMGTVNVIECIRKFDTRSSVIITSDKCYKNVEQKEGYVESDQMSDQDPYSTSKGCAEMIAQSYRFSYDLKLITTRAGNVIGGGDWAEDRLIPDIIRSLKQQKTILIRNPISVRPWQFVLEPLYGYLLLAMKKYLNPSDEILNGGWNFGPEVSSLINVERIARKMISKWGHGDIEIRTDQGMHEATLLFLDCTKAKRDINWYAKLDIDTTLDYIVEWYQNKKQLDDYELCVSQINKYETIR